MTVFALLSTLILAAAPATQPLSGDARRGAVLFKDQNCVVCHQINGKGGSSAPDLGARTAREYTPVALSSLMWNHAPAMWSSMAAQGIARPQLSEQDAADLFAFFASARYFEHPGEPARGRKIFEEKKCARCHVSSGPGKPPAEWRGLSDPIVLSEQMWNHAAQMRQAMKAQKVKWFPLTSQELTDLFLYLRNQPATRAMTQEFVLTPPGGGPAIMKEKGCTNCHQGRLTLENRFSGASLTDVATAMWNHAPKMAQDTPQLTVEEMREVVGYLWGTQLYRANGNAGKGKKIFAQKGCAGCHDTAGSGAPGLGGEGWSPVTMVSGLWRHGPAMLERMEQIKTAWPRFTTAEMSDLISYLNTRK